MLSRLRFLRNSSLGDAGIMDIQCSHCLCTVSLLLAGDVTDNCLNFLIFNVWYGRLFHSPEQALSMVVLHYIFLREWEKLLGGLPPSLS